MVTGTQLAKERGINVLQARYRKDGSWYHTLKRFPAALLDDNGFLLFETQQDYDDCADLNRSIKDGKDWLYPKDGAIAKITGYMAYELPLFAPESELANEAQMWEGGKMTVLVNRYERDARARQACINIYGAACSVCGFDFSKVYGDVGAGHIHVHHLSPISTLGKKYKVNPQEDLRPVCPNCHEMLHANKPEPFTIEELKDRLRLARERHV
jgi:HNH endonuclease